MATIVQRAVQNEGQDDGNFGMTEDGGKGTIIK
jgi:hypothetical protein